MLTLHELECDILVAGGGPAGVSFALAAVHASSPDGADRPDEEPCIQHALPHLYDIPLRSCVARDISNLLFAGRNLSAIHVAFSSTRVMATCSAVGQGVGTAAALAVDQAVPVSRIASNQPLLKAIQQRLLRDDAFLIGRRYTSSTDPVFSARVSVSSEQPGGEAANVIMRTNVPQSRSHS